MDDTFFNHLGPFFQTTPRIVTTTDTEAREITEKAAILPKVANNEVTWSPVLGQGILDTNDIYESDFVYYNDEWKPYEPTENEVNVTVDELTAPEPQPLHEFIGSEKIDTGKVKENKAPSLPFLDNFQGDYDYYSSSNSEDSSLDHENLGCPPKKCRCVCDDDI